MAKPSKIKPVGTGQDKFIRMLVYGNPGDRKTTLAGTSPNGLIMDADRGTEILKTRGLKADKWEVEDWDDINACVDWVRDEGTKIYDWLWLDSISGFQERGMDDIMRELVKTRANRKLYLPDKGEYGQNMNRLKLLLRGLRDLPINIGLICHMTRIEDDEGEVQYVPMVQGKDMIPTVCSYVGIVGRLAPYTMKDKTETVKFTTKKEDGKYYTKDRYNVGTIINPTIPKIVARIEEARAAGGRRPSATATKATPTKATATKKVTSTNG